MSLKYSLFAALLFLSTGLLGQLPERYVQVCFDSIERQPDLCYSPQAPKYGGHFFRRERIVERDMKLDLFLPPASDTFSKRAVVLLLHGGGFIDFPLLRKTRTVGTRKNQDMQDLADSLAHRGFVVACLGYRRGFSLGSQRSVERAIWRASQDVSAAVRFFRHHAKELRIDPDAIFAAGSSAGGIAALHCSFIEPEERWEATYDLRKAQADLGALHSRPIAAWKSNSPALVQQDLDGRPNAVVGYWSALLDTTYLRGGYHIPLLLFHGSKDRMVPPDSGMAFGGISKASPVFYGSLSITEACQRLGIPVEQHIHEGGIHEYWGAFNGEWLPDGPTGQWAEMVAQTAAFLAAQVPRKTGA